MKRITYPTGYVADVLEVNSDDGRVRLTVEKVVKPEPRLNLMRYRPGDVEVTGSFIPRGARGVLCHESLPVWTWKGPGWPYGSTTAWNKAQAFAERLCAKLEKQTGGAA